MIKPATLFALTLPLCAVGLSSCNLIGGLVKIALPFAGLKVAYACIPAGTSVDTPTGPKTIEILQAGDTVTGYRGKPVRILQKHSYLENPQTPFLRISFADGATVDLCGRHRLTGLQARHLATGQSIGHRTITGIETRTGITQSYDLLTEDPGYQIQGIPVNSMIEELHAAAAGMQAIRDE